MAGWPFQTEYATSKLPPLTLCSSRTHASSCSCRRGSAYQWITEEGEHGTLISFFFFWKIKLITGTCPPFLLPCSVTLFSILYRRNFWNLHHDRYTTTNLWKVFIKVHKELDDRGGSGFSRFGSKSNYFYMIMTKGNFCNMFLYGCVSFFAVDILKH